MKNFGDPVKLLSWPAGEGATSETFQFLPCSLSSGHRGVNGGIRTRN
jgi:hypothetical protein